MREEQKKVIQKEMDRLEHLGIIHKGLTGYSSPVVLYINLFIIYIHVQNSCSFTYMVIYNNIYTIGYC